MLQWHYRVPKGLKDYQQEFSTPFEPFSPVEPVNHTPLEVNEVFIAPDIERLMQTYDTFHDLHTALTNDDIKLSLENALPTDISHLEQKLMSLLELTPEKVIKIQTSNIFCKNIISTWDVVNMTFTL